MNKEIESIVKEALSDFINLNYSLCFWEQETKLIILCNKVSCCIVIDDDALSIYDLYTEEEFRRLGLASFLFEIIEFLAKKLNRKELFLFCTPDTWQHDWYIRKGFKYYLENNDPKGTVWLNKILE